MEIPETSRVAGEAFSMITGADLVEEALGMSSTGEIVALCLDFAQERYAELLV